MSQHFLLASLLAELEGNLRDPRRLEQMIAHISMEIETRRIEFILAQRMLKEIDDKVDHPARNLYFILHEDGKYQSVNRLRTSNVLAATRYTASEIGFTELFRKHGDEQSSKFPVAIAMREGLQQHQKSLRGMINLLRLARCSLKSRHTDTTRISGARS